MVLRGWDGQGDHGWSMMVNAQMAMSEWTVPPERREFRLGLAILVRNDDASWLANSGSW